MVPKKHMTCYNRQMKIFTNLPILCMGKINLYLVLKTNRYHLNIKINLPMNDLMVVKVGTWTLGGGGMYNPHSLTFELRRRLMATTKQNSRTW